MPLILYLYIETNFIMGIATGRDSEAESLLNNLPKYIHLFMPSICYLELLVAWENERKRKENFIDYLNKEINEIQRRKQLDTSENVVKILKQSSLSYQELSNDFELKLIDAVCLLENKINWISPQRGEFQTTLTEPILKKRKEIRDNLILQSILNHASNNMEIDKVFLSSNYKQFNKPEVKNEFKQVNVQYFSSSENLISWLNSHKDTEKS